MYRIKKNTSAISIYICLSVANLKVSEKVPGGNILLQGVN